MFEAPLTFTEAEAMLSARLDTPTALKYKEIAATWDADFRHRAFFSARVTEATVLSELHNRVQAVLDGKMTDKQAVALLRDYFVGPGADPLAKMGFAPKAGARTIAELASLPRLQLIVETNVRMAQECGHYQQWAESAAYYRYGVWRCGYAEEHREEHLARDGKAYAFDHPIWTQSPPGGEFNCHCYREIASEDEIKAMGLSPEPPSSPFTPSSLGFDPSRGMADPPPFGKRVRPEYQEKAQEKIDAFLSGEEPVQPGPSLPVNAPVRPTSASEAVAPAPVFAPAPPAATPAATPAAETPSGDANRFEGSGTTRSTIADPRLSAGVDAARDAIAEVTGAKSPPFNSTHRVMTEREIEAYAKEGRNPVGSHQRKVGKAGETWHDIALRPDCAYPAFTDMHEMVHAYIDEGIIRKKDVERIYERVKFTRTYEENDALMRNRYGDKRINEWVTRAITWSWMSQSTNEKIKGERLALAKEADYSSHTVWKNFGRSTDARLADLELEEEIMKLTPKTLLGKLKRKLGLSDTPPPMKSKGDEVLTFGFTRRELIEYCKRDGITLEEFLTHIEESEKKRAAMKPEDRQIVEM